MNQKAVGDKRDNISVHEANDKSCADSAKSKVRRSTSTDSSSPERYRYRDKKHSSPPPGRCKSSERSTRDKCDRNVGCSAATKTEQNKIIYESRTRTPTPLKKKPTVKVPYYRDEARERDRLRRLYGDKDRDRSPSRSIPHSKKGSPVPKHKVSSPNRRHSSSRDDYRRHTSYRSSRREYRYRRSRTRSRTRSPRRRDRESHKRSSRERNDHIDITSVAATVIPPTPQFIHIPVAVPAEYAYSFPGWPPQSTWTPSHRPPPPPHFAPFPMYPMMAPMRPPQQAGYRGLPPPLTYGPMQGVYRSNAPQRFTLTRHSSYSYQQRFKKPSS